MSRCGYSDELDHWQLIRWRGQVASAIRGKRGQAFLRELLAALDAMPDKRLIAYDLQDTSGQVCTLGCIAAARGLNIDPTDPDSLDAEDHEGMAARFNIASQLVQEIEFENDEWPSAETPEARWERMRSWVVKHLVTGVSGAAPQ